MSDALREAYRVCEGIVRERAANFRYAFPFLPAAKKRAISAVYAFSRKVDDVSDGDLPQDEKRRRLQALRRTFRDACHGRASDPVFIALADAMVRYAIPPEPFEDLINGATRDLTVTRYATWPDLEEYCRLVASSVGLICLEIFTYAGEAARGLAMDLGKAMQLSNIIRDVEEDARRDRIYLPREDLDRYGVSEEDVLTGRDSKALRELIRFETGRARALFDRARPLQDHLPRHARSCPAILARTYRALLQRIERDGWSVFGRRATLSPARKAWIAFTGLAGSLT